jgi:hypothetical protein
MDERALIEHSIKCSISLSACGRVVECGEGEREEKGTTQHKSLRAARHRTESMS